MPPPVLKKDKDNFRLIFQITLEGQYEIKQNHQYKIQANNVTLMLFILIRVLRLRECFLQVFPFQTQLSSEAYVDIKLVGDTLPYSSRFHFVFGGVGSFVGYYFAAVKKRLHSELLDY